MKKRSLYFIILAAAITLCALVGLAIRPYLTSSYLARATTVLSGATGSHNDPMAVDGHGFIKRTYTDILGRSITYYLFVPQHYNPKQKYPLVLLLHGGGERANPKNTEAKNEKQIVGQTFVQVWGTGFTLSYNPQVQQHWPSFIVVPQLTNTQKWVNVPLRTSTYVQPAQPSESLLVTKEMLDSLQQEYTGIDAQRLYIIGFSLGGYGTWDAISRWPNYFAAAVPIAGVGDPSKAKKLINIPIWAFQGADDKSVPIAASRTMIAAIKAAGGHPRYTEFANTPHSVWWRVFSATGTAEHVNGFYTWLFAQKRQ